MPGERNSEGRRVRMRRFLANFFPHQHQWSGDGSFRRTCDICDRREILVQRKYPQIGEPALFWTGFDDTP